MANEKKEVSKESLRLAQTKYKGNSQFDYVDVIIIENGDFYKKGDEDRVHPTVAHILKEKGLIGDFEKDVVSRSSKGELLSDADVQKVLEGDKEI